MSKSCYMTEYVSDLLLNIFDGLLMGELEIERRLLEVKQSLNLSNEDFVDKYITDDVVRRELVDIFPVQRNSDKSSIDEGSEYIKSTDTIKESPKIRLFTGYNMVDGTDYKEDATGKVLITKEGYNNIFATVQNNLLITRRTVLTEYINKGVPSFMINDGKISSRVMVTDLQGNPGEKPKKIFVSGFKYKCYMILANNFDNILLVKEGESKGFEIKNTDLSQLTFIDFEGCIEIVEDGNYEFDVKCDKAVYVKIIGASGNMIGINSCNGYLSKKKYTIQIRYYNDYFFYKYDIVKHCSNIPNDTIQPTTWVRQDYKIELQYGGVNSSAEKYTMIDSCGNAGNKSDQSTRGQFINLRKGYNRFKVDAVNCQRLDKNTGSVMDITIGYSVLGK